MDSVTANQSTRGVSIAGAVELEAPPARSNYVKTLSESDLREKLEFSIRVLERQDELFENSKGAKARAVQFYTERLSDLEETYEQQESSLAPEDIEFYKQEIILMQRKITDSQNFLNSADDPEFKADNLRGAFYSIGFWLQISADEVREHYLNGADFRSMI